MIIHAHSVPPTSVSTLLLRPWFVILVSAGAIERLCGMALGVASERDWVVLVLSFNASPVSMTCHLLFKIFMILSLSGLFPQLAGMNRPVALAQANAVLNRIDLLCEVFTCFVLFYLFIFLLS